MNSEEESFSQNLNQDALQPPQTEQIKVKSQGQGVGQKIETKQQQSKLETTCAPSNFTKKANPKNSLQQKGQQTDKKQKQISSTSEMSESKQDKTGSSDVNVEQIIIDRLMSKLKQYFTSEFNRLLDKIKKYTDSRSGQLSMVKIKQDEIIESVNVKFKSALQTFASEVVSKVVGEVKKASQSIFQRISQIEFNLKSESKQALQSSLNQIIKNTEEIEDKIARNGQQIQDNIKKEIQQNSRLRQSKQEQRGKKFNNIVDKITELQTSIKQRQSSQEALFKKANEGNQKKLNELEIKIMEKELKDQNKVKSQINKLQKMLEEQKTELAKKQEQINDQKKKLKVIQKLQQEKDRLLEKSQKQLLTLKEIYKQLCRDCQTKKQQIKGLNLQLESKQTIRQENKQLKNEVDKVRLLISTLYPDIIKSKDEQKTNQSIKQFVKSELGCSSNKIDMNMQKQGKLKQLIERTILEDLRAYQSMQIQFNKKYTRRGDLLKDLNIIQNFCKGKDKPYFDCISNLIKLVFRLQDDAALKKEGQRKFQKLKQQIPTALKARKTMDVKNYINNDCWNLIIKNIISSINVHIQDLMTKDKENDGLKENIKQLQLCISSMQGKNKELQVNNKELQQNIKKLQRNIIIQLNDNNTKLTEQVLAQRQKSKRLGQQLETQQQKNTKLNKDLREQKKNYQKLEHQLRNKSEQYDELKAIYTSYKETKEGEITQSRQKYKKLEDQKQAQRKKATNQYNLLQSQLRIEKSNAKNMKQNLQQQIEEKQKFFEEKARQNKSFEDKIKNYEEEKTEFLKNLNKVISIAVSQNFNITFKNYKDQLSEFLTASEKIKFLAGAQFCVWMNGQKKSFIFNSIKALVPRKIKRTKLLFEGYQDAIFERWLYKIYEKPNLLVLLRLKNNYEIAVFCEQPFQKQRPTGGKACLMSITNMKRYDLLKKQEGKALHYWDRGLIIGNDELTIFHTFTFNIIFGTNSCYFDTKGRSILEFVGQEKDKLEYSRLEFHQVIFE